MTTKPAIKSLGVWGSMTAIVSWLYLAVDVLSSLPPDLIDETKAAWVMIIGVLGTLMALVGRWRAVMRIKGFLFKF